MSLEPTATTIDQTEIETTVRDCARQFSGSKLVSTADAIEELRIRTGDFLSSDAALARAVSAAAVKLGCAVLLDEEV